MQWCRSTTILWSFPFHQDCMQWLHNALRASLHFANLALVLFVISNLNLSFCSIVAHRYWVLSDACLNCHLIKMPLNLGWQLENTHCLNFPAMRWSFLWYATQSLFYFFFHVVALYIKIYHTVLPSYFLFWLTHLPCTQIHLPSWNICQLYTFQKFYCRGVASPSNVDGITQTLYLLGQS